MTACSLVRIPMLESHVRLQDCKSFNCLMSLQAQRLSALASSQIQDAYESAGQGSNVRKRKLAEASNALTQQIGEVLAEGHEFSEKPATQVRIGRAYYSRQAMDIWCTQMVN